MLIAALVIAFFAVWIAYYRLWLRPRLVSFRYTAGIYRQLDDFEGPFLAKLAIYIRGFKVAAIGALTSAMPMILVAWQQIQGFDFTKVLPDEKAQIAVGIVAVISFVGPIVMSAISIGAVAKASAAAPVDPPSTVPPQSAGTAS